SGGIFRDLTNESGTNSQIKKAVVTGDGEEQKPKAKWGGSQPVKNVWGKGNSDFNVYAHGGRTGTHDLDHFHLIELLHESCARKISDCRGREQRDRRRPKLCFLNSAHPPHAGCQSLA